MRLFTSDRYLMRGRGLNHFPASFTDDGGALIRGKGVGSVFTRIFSSVVPFIKGALKVGKKVGQSSVGRSLAREVKRSATEAGLNVVADALQGKNVVQSSKENLVKARNRVGKRLADLSKTTVDGPPPRKKQKRKAPAGKTFKTAAKPKMKKARGAGKKKKKARKGKKKCKKTYRAGKRGGGSAKGRTTKRSTKRGFRPGRRKTVRDLFG